MIGSAAAISISNDFLQFMTMLGFNIDARSCLDFLQLLTLLRRNMNYMRIISAYVGMEHEMEKQMESAYEDCLTPADF